jgi:hypothetical protein
MMDAQTERVVDKVIKYGTVFAEVSAPTWVLHIETSRELTLSSCTQSQRLSSVLPASRLRFVLATRA